MSGFSLDNELRMGYARHTTMVMPGRQGLQGGFSACPASTNNVNRARGVRESSSRARRGGHDANPLQYAQAYGGQ